MLDEGILIDKTISNLKNKIRYCLYNEEFPLERLLIAITNNCNLKCIHCHLSCNNSNDYFEISLSEFENIINQAKELGVWKIDLTGGEIFTHPNLFDFLDILRKNKFIVNLFTNGTLIDEEIAYRISTYDNIHKIIISFDSINESLFETIRGRKGSFRRLLNCISNLKSYNIPLAFNVGYFKENSIEIIEILKFLHNYSDEVIIHTILPLGRANKLDNRKYINEYIEVLKSQPKVNNNNQKSFENRLDTNCGFAENFLYIEDANVFLCPTLKVFDNNDLCLGSLKKLSLKEIWTDNTIISYFRQSKCENYEKCSNYSLCKNGCRCRAILNSNKNIFARDKILCSYYGEN